MPTGGGTLQLVAQGDQDVFLTGSPQLSFFRFVYRRYTPFAMESVRIPVTGVLDFGRLVTVDIPRSGDLLGSLILELVLPALQLDAGDSPPPLSYVNGIGYAMIEWASLQFGGQEIDRQTGEWLYTQMQLTTPGAKRDGIYNMVGFQDAFTDGAMPGPMRLYVPLGFWFNRNPGLMLPLLALQRTPIRLQIQFRAARNCVFSTAMDGTPPGVAVYSPQNLPTVTDATLWGEYVYLGKDEQRRFVNNAHEYLIEQVQRMPRTSVPASVALVNIPVHFNHPLKELLWLVQEDRTKAANEIFNYSNRQNVETGTVVDLIDAVVIRIDGVDRFEQRSAQWFRLVEPWLRHTAVPDDFIYTYAFSMSPESAQPMGAMNASALNSIVLSLIMHTSDYDDEWDDEPSVPGHQDCSVAVYATNYNILRIVDGLGGLLFAT
jgi:hypothetical protein